MHTRVFYLVPSPVYAGKDSSHTLRLNRVWFEIHLRKKRSKALLEPRSPKCKHLFLGPLSIFPKNNHSLKPVPNLGFLGESNK